MALKNETSVKGIIETLVNGKLYEKDLKKKDFKVFVEILSNAQRKKLNHCFSNKSRRGLKKHRKTVKKLTTRKISTSRRMKLLRKSSDNFRRVVRCVINDFLTRCVESGEND